MKKSKKATTKKPQLPDLDGLQRIKDRVSKEGVDVDALLKTPALVSHPHLETARWVLISGFSGPSVEDRRLSLDAFAHALANRGRLLRGVALGSKEHAAALAGAALWRHYNPSDTKGGPGRGQGRKAVDGCTDLSRVTVMMRNDQRGSFKSLGGSAWLRQQIDQELLKREQAKKA